MRALALPFALAALASPAVGAPYCWKELPLPAGLGPLSSADTDGARHWLLAGAKFLEWDGASAHEVPLSLEMSRGEPEHASGPLLSLAGSLARWNGAEWEPLGAPASALPHAEPGTRLDAVALRRDGRPVAAMSKPLLVAAWDGGRWRPLGGPLDPGSDLHDAGVALAVDEQDRPWIAWAAGIRSAATVRVMRWSGSRWEDVGHTARGALGSPQAADDWSISLLVLPGGRAVVAWIAAGQPASGAAEWDGDHWYGMGPPLSVEDATGPPVSLILTAGRDGVFLAEQVADETGFQALYVQQWIGGNWQWVLEGAHLEPAGDARLVAFEAAGGSRLRLTWNESSPHVIEAGSCRWAESPNPFPRKRWRRADWPWTVADAVVEPPL